MQTKTDTFANCVDQMRRQELHCLQVLFCFQTETPICINGYVLNKDRKIPLQKFGGERLKHINVQITKTRLYNFDSLKSHFYIVKLGLKGVYIIFLILLKNIYCEFSLEPPRRVPIIYILSRDTKNIRIFYLKIFLFWLKIF